jgi:hypothetical protein
LQKDPGSYLWKDLPAVDDREATGAERTLGSNAFSSMFENDTARLMYKHKLNGLFLVRTFAGKKKKKKVRKSIGKFT